MKPIFLPLLSLLLLFSCQSSTKEKPTAHKQDTPPAATPKPRPKTAPAKTVQDYFIHRYQGSIGEYPIELVLVNWADGQLSGWYQYLSQNKRIDLQGEINLDERFTLSEYTEDGKQSGLFKGNLANPYELSGQWSTADSSKQLDYQLKVLSSSDEAAQAWNGDWFINDPWDGGVLLMSAGKEQKLDFALSIGRNTHIGLLIGTATRQGNKASYKAILPHGAAPCELKFELKGKEVEIKQNSSPSACGMGARAHADGIYEPESVDVKPKLGFGENEVFASQAQHDAFKKWIGRSTYEKVAFNMRVIDKKKAVDKEHGINGTAVAGGVPGLYTLHEAIILYDDRNRFWVASMDQNERAQTVIRYFTNDDAMKAKLPKAIADWRNPFEDYLVVFPR